MDSITHVLVTGGAGFIGSHLVDRLVTEGYRVRILDNLTPQVHQGKVPSYLNAQAEFMQGDVTNPNDIARALEGMDAIYHMAAAVGVGQSMYEIARYVHQNTYGTACVLDHLVNHPHHVKRLLLPSSMTGYGEGMSRCAACGPVRAPLREDAQMEAKDWEIHCPKCGKAATPIPTPESTPLASRSVYAMTKQTQEDLALLIGQAYNIPTTVFRYFNVYGPRQSLSNPYTGVTAIFLSRLKNDHRPVVYEDGLQSRDFVSVYDVADVAVRALKNDKTFGHVFNVGTGIGTSIKDVAMTIAALLGKDLPPECNGAFRSRDIRHCIADISQLTQAIDWQPAWDFTRGMRDLMAWGEKEQAEDRFDQATRELDAKGLLKS